MGVLMTTSTRRVDQPGFGTYVGIAVIGIALAITIGIASHDLIWTVALLALSAAMLAFAFIARRRQRTREPIDPDESNQP